MLPDKSEAAYLWDMLDAAKAVCEFMSAGSCNDYLSDRMLRGAVERHVEIISEASGRVSKALRKAHPEIAWQRIIAQRHVPATNTARTRA